LGASFTLRNVIDNEPLEINFQLYSPLIQELKVLKHQKFKEHQLKYLRDYPPAFSYVSEKMKEQPYTEEPELFEFNEEHKKKIDRWFSRLNQRKL
jgi:large subunit ribosomal protein L19